MMTEPLSLFNRWDWLTKADLLALDTGDIHNIVDVAKARLDAVLALHAREGTFRGLRDENMFCVGCGSAWPCPTVRAATGDA